MCVCVCVIFMFNLDSNTAGNWFNCVVIVQRNKRSRKREQNWCFKKNAAFRFFYFYYEEFFRPTIMQSTVMTEHLLFLLNAHDDAHGKYIYSSSRSVLFVLHLVQGNE